MGKKKAFSAVATWLFLAILAGCSKNPDQPPAAAGREPVAGDIVINEFLADPDSDVNCDGSTSLTQDEFIELVNMTDDTLNLSNVTVSVGTVTRHVFAANTALLPMHPVVIFSGGSPSCTVPAGVMVLVASSGSLVLLNSGATIIVRNGAGTNISEATYNNTLVRNDVSTNREPELTGVLSFHDSLPGSIGNYSPGIRANGSSFF